MADLFDGVDQVTPETPIRLYRYDSIDFSFIYPMDLSSFTVKLEVKQAVDGTSLFVLEQGSGLTVTTGLTDPEIGPHSKVEMQLSQAQYQSLAALSGAVYDLEIRQGTYRKTYFRGAISAVKDVTQ